ncbi:MAG: PQQ-dependent dehydrogenase, methanol/ethanol family, partial [Pseudomonas sp. PGPPP3]
TVKATAHADRNGFFYVVDRNNGKLQNAFPFVDKITWASHIDLKTGRPVEIEGQRPPKPAPGETKGKSVEVSPPFLGGKNWSPMAYSQDTGLFYVPANHWKEDYWAEEPHYKAGSAYLGMGFRIKRLYDDHVGILRAMNPTGTGIISPPITWEQDGEQYIGVTTGYGGAVPLWGGDMAELTKPVAQGGSFWVFKLPSWDK